MKIFLLLNQPYPRGFALTKRFHLYAKGLVQGGHRVKMIIPLPIEENDKLANRNTSGSYDEVPFQYTWKNTTRSKNFFIRRYHDFTGSVKVGSICIKERPDVVITTSFSIFFYLYLKLISVLTSFTFIREINEVDNMTHDFTSGIKKLKTKCFYNLFNGFIVISSQLLHYLKHELKIRKKFIVVPILVEDFKKEKKRPVQKTIVYTGTYLERKDGIISILNAFAEIINKHPDYKLILTGSPHRSADYSRIKDTISSRELDSHVQFTGYLSEEALREVLISANMLILAKPENRQNLYNFPTKMGEYLISGRPVIATKVGAPGEILEDGKNIIFSEYQIKRMEEKMELVINNPEWAKMIGNNGRQYALENFNYLKHTERMVDFFKN